VPVEWRVHHRIKTNSVIHPVVPRETELLVVCGIEWAPALIQFVGFDGKPGSELVHYLDCADSGGSVEGFWGQLERERILRRSGFLG